MLLKVYLTVEQVAKQPGLGQWRVKKEDLMEFIKSRANE